MKNTSYLVFSIILGVIFFQSLSFFGLPLWLIFLCTPVLLYGQIYFSNSYNFRKSLDFSNLPLKGYEDRLAVLNKNKQILQEMGFQKFDEFYLKLSNDVIVYVYKHLEEEITYYDYHFGSFNNCDLVTKFKDGFTLTTSNTENASLIPRPNENMLQIFLGHSFEELLAKHQHTVKFLQQKGFRVRKVEVEGLRERFLKEYRKIGKSVTNPLSPFKIFYWIYANKKGKHLKPVQEQFLAKTLELPKY